MHFELIVANQNKKIKNHDTIHFENTIHRVLHEQSNITASFEELPVFSIFEMWSFLIFVFLFSFATVYPKRMYKRHLFSKF